jgi:hypothetical protein
VDPRLREVLVELEKKLDPDRKRKTEAARKAVEEDDELKLRAELDRHGTKSVGELYARGAYRTPASGS